MVLDLLRTIHCSLLTAHCSLCVTGWILELLTAKRFSATKLEVSCCQPRNGDLPQVNCGFEPPWATWIAGWECPLCRLASVSKWQDETRSQMLAFLRRGALASPAGEGGMLSLILGA